MTRSLDRPETRLRVAIYARFSTDKQNPMSARDQIASCETYAARNGWEVVAQFADEAISGSTDLRPDYAKLRQAVEERSIDIVLAEGLDRISRDQEHIANFYTLCDYREVQIFTVADGKVGRMHIGMKGTLNALYLETLALQVRRGQREKVRHGLAAGGKAYGYRVAISANGLRQPGALEIVEAEALVVRRILQAYADGKSPISIAVELNNEKIRAPGGAHWKQNTINGNRERGTGILNNELYVGRRIWNRLRYLKKPSGGRSDRISRLNPRDEWVISEVPELRIVSDELWQKVKARQQAQDAKRKPQEGADRNRLSGGQSLRRVHYLLSGLIRCGCCGGKMVIAGSGRQRYYCANAREKGPAACSGMKGVLREEIEKLVLSGIQRDLMQPDAVAAFVESYARHFNELTRGKADRAAAAQKRLKAVDREIANLINILKRGLHSVSIEDELKALEAEKATLSEAVASEAEPLPEVNPRVAELYRAKVRELAEALGHPDSQARAGEALRGLLERVVVHYDATTATHGVEIVGELAALLGFAGNENAAAIAAAAGSLKLVAGVGFEPTTFRL